MPSFILSGDLVVTGVDEPVITDGAVLVDGERVVAIGSVAQMRSRNPGAEERGGPGHVVIPGLIDAHQHGRGVTNIQRGVPDGFLEQWLIRLRGLWPMDPYLTTLVAALRLIRSGVTTAMHHFASTGVVPFEEEIDATLRAYRDAGMRVTFTLDFRDRNYYVYAPDSEFLSSLPSALAGAVSKQLPPRVLPKPSEVMALLSKVRRSWGSPKLRLALGPQGGEWSSDESLKDVAAFARAESLPIHTHMLESRLQRHASLREHGISAVERFARLGLLGANTSLAHMVWVTDLDLDIVRDAGAAIVHNPASNLRLRSGIAPVLRMLRRGIPVAIGMDGMSLSDQGDYFQDLRLCRSLHFDDQGALDSPDVWRMVYEGGGRATFWGDSIGRLRPGCWADAVVMRLPVDVAVAPLDPVWRVQDRVLREGGPSAIRTVVVGGRVVIDNGIAQTVDEPAILDAVRSYAGSADAASVTTRRHLVKQLEAAVADYYRSWNVGDDARALNAIHHR